MYGRMYICIYIYMCTDMCVFCAGQSAVLVMASRSSVALSRHLACQDDELSKVQAARVLEMAWGGQVQYTYIERERERYGYRYLDI